MKQVPNVVDTMMKRVENFMKAMKKPDKRLPEKRDTKHDAHMVDTQGFNPKVHIHVSDEEGDE